MVASMNRGSEAPGRERRLLGYCAAAILGVVVVSACSDDAAVPATPTTDSVVTTTEPSSTTGSTPAPTSTSTSVERSTTTTSPVAACRLDPFAPPFPGQLSARYPDIQITAHVYDSRTGCQYRLNPSNRQPTASVFKVMVMAGTLLEAQEDDRELSDWELGQLIPMITQSTNPQVRRLWRSFGSSPWFRQQAEIFDLSETQITADRGSAWGRTMTSAADQVWLLRQVLLGEDGPLTPDYREEALALMTSVVPEQTWGVTAGYRQPGQWPRRTGLPGLQPIRWVGWMNLAKATVMWSLS